MSLLTPPARKADDAGLRYYDRQLGCQVTKVMPGECQVGDAATTLVTLLGSCVAACIRDPLAGVGGMNHFMLTTDECREAPRNARYGAYAMELLINELLKRGGERRRLQAKVFGGGNVMPGLARAPIGGRNAAFVLDYLHREDIPVVAQDLCGVCARKVVYCVDSGRVLVRQLAMTRAAPDLAAERAYLRVLRTARLDGEVEVFE